MRCTKPYDRPELSASSRMLVQLLEVSGHLVAIAPGDPAALLELCHVALLVLVAPRRTGRSQGCCPPMITATTGPAPLAFPGFLR
jgi:hypothetical protein